MKTRLREAGILIETVGNCERCGDHRGECRWIAGSRSAERARPEMRLCVRCTQSLETFIRNGHSIGKAMKLLRKKGRGAGGAAGSGDRARREVVRA
jgi:hypothetical protein